MRTPLIPSVRAAPWFVFSLVLVWKVALLALTTQPVPANDAFFYDGPVVNYLLHGKYVNPALARTLPISGTEVFSAYPPLYQAVLFVWMSLFGTSAVSAMVFHLLLFGCYSLVLLAILVRLAVPTRWIHLGSAFLFVITFHDRPDSLAHLLGMLAVYGWVRSVNRPETDSPSNNLGWRWFMAWCAVLCVCTSLQVGTVYLCLLWLCTSASAILRARPFPAWPLLATVVVPGLILVGIMLFAPRWWAGFLEHARATPSLTGLRVPSINDALKIVRTVPGVLAAGAYLGWLVGQRKFLALCTAHPAGTVAMASTLTALAIVTVCAFLWSPNMVQMAGYLQPIVVACVLACISAASPSVGVMRRVEAITLALACLGSIRAFGMTTWGTACAVDVGYRKAMEIVRRQLAEVKPGNAVVISSAYLYESARQKSIQWVHSDWAGKFERGKRDQELQWLVELRPAKMILTQFDFYRRYEPVLTALKRSGVDVGTRVANTAKVRAPDSYRLWQRVVQHISWAPVIVEFEWH